MSVDSISTLIKISCIILFSFYIARRSLNREKYNKIQVFIIFIETILLTVVYMLTRQYFDVGISLCIVYLFMGCGIKLLNKYELNFSMLTMLTSMSICVVSFGIATFIAFAIYKIFNINNYIINSILIEMIQLLLIILFFRTKRFKKRI